MSFWKRWAGALFVDSEFIKVIQRGLRWFPFVEKKEHWSYLYTVVPSPPPFFFFLQFLLIYQDARKLGLKRPKQKPFHFILLLKTHLWLPIASSTKSQLLSTPAKGLPSLILQWFNILLSFLRKPIILPNALGVRFWGRADMSCTKGVQV